MNMIDIIWCGCFGVMLTNEMVAILILFKYKSKIAALMQNIVPFSIPHHITTATLPRRHSNEIGASTIY